MGITGTVNLLNKFEPCGGFFLEKYMNEKERVYYELMGYDWYMVQDE
jgi:hypothetical protein